jgi:heme exporter protein D
MSEFFFYLFVAARGFVKYVWPAVGPLVGVFIGAWIANRNQRKQWVADNRKQEYRELLTALVNASGDVMERLSPMAAHGPESQKQFYESERAVGIIIYDRIFIARDVKEMNLGPRWITAINEVNRNGDVRLFAERISQMQQEIGASALKVVESV